MNRVNQICTAGKKARNRVTRSEIELLQRLHALATPIVNQMKNRSLRVRPD